MVRTQLVESGEGVEEGGEPRLGNGLLVTLQPPPETRGQRPYRPASTIKIAMVWALLAGAEATTTSKVKSHLGMPLGTSPLGTSLGARSPVSVTSLGALLQG